MSFSKRRRRKDGRKEGGKELIMLKGSRWVAVKRSDCAIGTRRRDSSVSQLKEVGQEVSDGDRH